MVDLEALLGELGDAGCAAAIEHGPNLVIRRDTQNDPMWANVWTDGHGSYDGEYDWTMLDIIRRHVQTVAAAEPAQGVTGEARRVPDAETVAAIKRMFSDLDALLTIVRYASVSMPMMATSGDVERVRAWLAGE